MLLHTSELKNAFLPFIDLFIWVINALSILHTVRNQKLDSEKAWRRGTIYSRISIVVSALSLFWCVCFKFIHRLFITTV